MNSLVIVALIMICLFQSDLLGEQVGSGDRRVGGLARRAGEWARGNESGLIEPLPTFAEGGADQRFLGQAG
jgi:hypothetical protein